MHDLKIHIAGVGDVFCDRDTADRLQALLTDARAEHYLYRRVGEWAPWEIVI